MTTEEKIEVLIEVNKSLANAIEECCTAVKLLKQELDLLRSAQ